MPSIGGLPQKKPSQLPHELRIFDQFRQELGERMTDEAIHAEIGREESSRIVLFPSTWISLGIMRDS